MSDPFIAEVRIFAGNFPPRGWAFCDGQVLPINQNTALFSLIGTTYGGDGRTTTALPDLQGRAPMHPGRGPGLTSRRLGDRAGTTTETLSQLQLPSHKHAISAPEGEANSTTASGNTWGVSEDGDNFRNSPDIAMSGMALAASGGGSPHNNLQPYLVMNFIIALIGLYPSRS